MPLAVPAGADHDARVAADQAVDSEPDARTSKDPPFDAVASIAVPPLMFSWPPLDAIVPEAVPPLATSSLALLYTNVPTVGAAVRDG